jgi:heptosyltransferase I
MHGMQNKRTPRFLVIRWSGMGDVVMTLPALKWLSDHFRHCEICYLTDRSFAKIPQLSEHVHHVTTIDRRGFKTRKNLPKTIWQTVVTIFRLRRKKFHMVFDLQGFGETSIIAFLTGAPTRLGRVKESPLRRRMYTIPILADWEHDHRSRYFVKAITRAFGYGAPAYLDRPLIRVGEKKPVARRLRIGLNIGASTASRRWSEKNFFLLAHRLSLKGYTIRFFLGPQERFLAETVKCRCDAEGWEFFIHKDLDTLIAALSACRLLVSNDTGPGHLAAALDIPVVTLFSTGSPENVRPLATHGKWLRNRSDINEISVSDVETACRSLLDG